MHRIKHASCLNTIDLLKDGVQVIKRFNLKALLNLLDKCSCHG